MTVVKGVKGHCHTVCVLVVDKYVRKFRWDTVRVLTGNIILLVNFGGGLEDRVTYLEYLDMCAYHLA